MGSRYWHQTFLGSHIGLPEECPVCRVLPNNRLPKLCPFCRRKWQDDDHRDGRCLL